MKWRNKHRFLLHAFLLIIFSSSFILQVFAQVGGVADGETYATNPKTRETTVTATVPDNAPPTTPILIAPENNSKLTINKPTFIWEASTDANGIDRYEMSLDGSTYFYNIPTNDTENDDYILDYNSITGRYSLTPKVGLSEGDHTWKIRAIDNLDNGTDSATWSFSVDTQAPSFVLTSIGAVTTSISAQDPSTIPSIPVELEDNQPLLTATGEAGSTVQLTLTIPGDPTQSFTVDIDSGGNFQHQLGILPRDVIMTMDFIITDPSGNVSILSGVQFVINSAAIIIPPVSPSPSPTPAVTPTPGVTPQPSPTPSPTVSPSPEASPIITIPLIPPEEIIHEVIQETGELLPPQIVNLAKNAPKIIEETVVNTIELIAPVSALVATAAVPTLSTLMLFSQFGQDISLKIFVRVLQALGLLPKKRPQGMVFNSQTDEPIAFALITIQSVDTTPEETITETVVTDTSGIYQGIKLIPGKYRIFVNHQDYSFPTFKPRPAYMSFLEFYKGEVFEVKSEEQEHLYLIPVDPKETQTQKTTFRSKTKLLMAQLRLKDLTIPLFSFSLVVATFFPSLVNTFVLGLYGILLTKKAIKSTRVPGISGKIIDEKGEGIPHAIIRLTESNTNQLIALISSNEHGEFKVFTKKDLYQLVVTKQGMTIDTTSSQLSFQEIDTREESQYVVIKMKEMGDVYAELGL